MFGGNKRAFAIHVGISPTVVENVVGKRQGKPSFDLLVKVCSNANISAEWLLLGNGELFTDMVELRKIPMSFHSNPERYIEEGKVEITDEPAQISSQSDSTANQELLLRLLKEKDEEIGNNREEIGRLKAELAETKKHAERLAALVDTDASARVG